MNRSKNNNSLRKQFQKGGNSFVQNAIQSIEELMLRETKEEEKAKAKAIKNDAMKKVHFNESSDDVDMVGAKSDQDGNAAAKNSALTFAPTATVQPMTFGGAAPKTSINAFGGTPAAPNTGFNNGQNPFGGGASTWLNDGTDKQFAEPSKSIDPLPGEDPLAPEVMRRRVTALYTICIPAKLPKLDAVIAKYGKAGPAGFCKMSFSLGKKYPDHWTHVNPNSVAPHNSKSPNASGSFGNTTGGFSFGGGGNNINTFGGNINNKAGFSSGFGGQVSCANVNICIGLCWCRFFPLVLTFSSPFPPSPPLVVLLRPLHLVPQQPQLKLRHRLVLLGHHLQRQPVLVMLVVVLEPLHLERQQAKLQQPVLRHRFLLDHQLQQPVLLVLLQMRRPFRLAQLHHHPQSHHSQVVVLVVLVPNQKKTHQKTKKKTHQK